MKHMLKTIALTAAVALTLSTTLQAKESQRATPPGSVEFFLADPELGLAGAYSLGGETIYFEARRSNDGNGKTLGALGLRVVDAEGRTLALSGQPFNSSWNPQQGEFMMKEGFNYSYLLTGLGQTLENTRLHASLRGEKTALSTLAMGAANTAAIGFPFRNTTVAKRVPQASADQVADFYLDSTRNVSIERTPDDTLHIALADGLVFQVQQNFLADETDMQGRQGRINTSAILIDSEGYALAVETGGDEMPAAWIEAMQHETTRGYHDLARDFGRAASALNAVSYSAKSLPGASLSLSMEQDVMRRMALAAAENLLPERDRGNQKPERGVAPAKAGLYLTDIAVWAAGVFGAPSWVGEHSATYVQNWRYSNSTASSPRTRTSVRSFCNHGGCALESPMKKKCSYGGFRSTTYHAPSANNYTPFTNTWHTCMTPYYIDSRPGFHNCNDDSWTQVQAVHGRSYSVWLGRCSDIAFPTQHPSCD